MAIFVDSRGFGWSGKPFRWSTYCSDAEEFWKVLPEVCTSTGLPWPYPGGIVAMGRSMGAIPAVHLAALHSDQVEALVLDSPLACQYPFSSLCGSMDPEVWK